MVSYIAPQYVSKTNAIINSDYGRVPGSMVKWLSRGTVNPLFLVRVQVDPQKYKHICINVNFVVENLKEVHN